MSEENPTYDQQVKLMPQITDNHKEISDLVIRKLRRLRRASVWGKDDQKGAEVFKQINNFLARDARGLKELDESEDQDGNYDSFQQAVGVLSGAYGIANNIEDTYVLLQSANDLPQGLNMIKIPFLNRSGEDYADLLVFLFTQQRTRQPLKGFSGDKESFAPEFLWYLPPFHNKESVPLTEFQTKARRKSRTLYVPQGEIAFFLYAWRVLLRSLQTGQKDQLYIPRIQDCFGTPALWERQFRPLWADTEDENSKGIFMPQAIELKRLPEQVLMNAFFSLKGEADQLYRKLHKTDAEKERVLSVEKTFNSWGKCQKKYDAIAEQHPFINDCMTIGLFPDLRTPLTPNFKFQTDEETIFKSLIRYALWVVECGEFKGIEENVGINLREYLNCSSINLDELIKLNKLLGSIITGMLDIRSNTDGIIGGLRKLHRIARFAIIPYFYWWAMDLPGICPLTFPVWESNEFPIDIKLPLSIDTDERHLIKETGENYQIVESPVVGVCLLAILSMKGLDWTLEDLQNGEEVIYSEEAKTKLECIKSYYEEAFKPVVDQALYGVLIKSMLQSSTQLQSEAVLGHEVKHIINSLTEKWLVEPNDKLLEQANKLYTELSEVPKWRIAPFPELFESTGKLFKLWSQTNRIGDVFGENIPRKTTDLIQKCWDLAKNFLKPYSAYEYNLSLEGSISKVLDDFKFVDEKMWGTEQLFQIRVAEDVPNPGRRNPLKLETRAEIEKIKEFMDFVRLLMAIFGNCVRHGNHERPISVKLNYLPNSQNLKLEISNYKPTKDSDGKLPDSVCQARKELSASPLYNKNNKNSHGKKNNKNFHGKDVIELYAKKIGMPSKPQADEPNDEYRLTIVFPDTVLKVEL